MALLVSRQQMALALPSNCKYSHPRFTLRHGLTLYFLLWLTDGANIHTLLTFANRWRY
jgi:hypothetical protein